MHGCSQSVDAIDYPALVKDKDGEDGFGDCMMELLKMPAETWPYDKYGNEMPFKDPYTFQKQIAIKLLKIDLRPLLEQTVPCLYLFSTLNSIDLRNGVNVFPLPKLQFDFLYLYCIPLRLRLLQFFDVATLPIAFSHASMQRACLYLAKNNYDIESFCLGALFETIHCF